VIDSKPSEGLLLLPHHGGTIIAGDCFQHWAETDAYFNWPAKFLMKRMGFIKPHNIGPGWLKQCKPPKDQLRGVLDHAFANVLPAHGTPVVGDARNLYEPSLTRVSQ
jgi:hypothetical protein